MNDAVDFVGREITVGSTIAYAVRRGAKMWLTKLRVQQITPGDEPTVSGFNDAGRRVHITNLQNSVVVQEPDRRDVELAEGPSPSVRATTADGSSRLDGPLSASPCIAV